jgi:UDP-N-acetylmuramoyl-L-alanyl-D-glutamate--2,6-diaminopimelate ligase
MLANLLYHVKRPYHFLKTGLLRGFPARMTHGFPEKKLKIVTVTGTDGKTTSSSMLYHVLKTAGYKVALLSTVAAYVGDQAYDTGFHVTSPDPKDLYRFMKIMVDQGMEYLVLEATSHGSYQYRTWGIYPEIAAVTNIAHEHLDYHVNYDNYFDAKLMLLKAGKVAVINADDASGPRLKRELKEARKNVLEYSMDMPLSRVIKEAITKRFPQTYNKLNARLVATCALQLGVAPTQVAQGISSFTSVPGRMQEIPSKQGFKVVVDFAHTPQGLSAALSALRKELKATKKSKAGSLIAIFGCAGLRDRQKRPMMGNIGTELADIAIFTAEDPRTEDVWSIIHQMKSGVTKVDKVISIADRATAIRTALTELAKPGDIVGIFGKGHEQSMCYGTVEYPWSDVATAETILAELDKDHT